MRFRSLVISAALLSASSLAAHAGLITTTTTFTLTHGADTFQFSLSPSTAPFYVQLGAVQEFEYQVPLAVDGVMQLGNEGFEQLQPLGVGAEFYVGYVTGHINGVYYSRDLFEQGFQIYTYANGVLSFTPGTYVFTQVYVDDFDSTGASNVTLGPGDTLVITPGLPSATPEPSTFWLLGTGVLGAVAMVRRRFTGDRGV